ncbi:MAG: hypothetical protein ABWW65_02975 [Thermoprotei archaeon]
MERKLRWGNGYLIVKYTMDSLILKWSNSDIEVRPRSISIRGYSSYREAVDNKGKYRYIYVYFDETLKPFKGLEPNTPSVIRDVFEIRYTRTYYDEYYTIILPGSFFIEYMIFSSDVLVFVLSAKKRVFYEKLAASLIVYIV